MISNVAIRTKILTPKQSASYKSSLIEAQVLQPNEKPTQRGAFEQNGNVSG
jgi:hypothetical protein